MTLDRSMQILVVGEDEGVSDLIPLLRRWGFEVSKAASGRASLPATASNPDAILLDMIVPPARTLETVRRLRESLPDARIFPILPESGIETGIEALKLGASDLIVRPVDRHALRSLLEAADDEVVLRRRWRALASNLSGERVRALASQAAEPGFLHGRTAELAQLVCALIREFNVRHGADVAGVRDGALKVLSRCRWPGGLKELRFVIERSVVLAKSGWIGCRHLPAHLVGVAGSTSGRIVLEPGVTVAEAERLLILDTLRRTRNNKTEAARRLGLDARTVRNKLKSYGLSG